MSSSFSCRYSATLLLMELSLWTRGSSNCHITNWLLLHSGAEASTFGIHGVHEHATFLREVHHAQEIRRKLLLNMMLSDIPGIAEEEKQLLLHNVVVGDGPAGVEFSGELCDFIMKDVHQRYAHVKDYIHVTLTEANEILSSFDDRLRHYAVKQLTKAVTELPCYERVRYVGRDISRNEELSQR